MKKLIGTVAVAALLASAAFAEISFGSWLRAIAVPVAGDGEDIKSGMVNSWGWGARVARVDIRGTSEDEKAGFSMQIFNDHVGGLSDGDEAVLWVRPWDFLKVSLGHYDYTTFRGDLTFGSWGWVRPQNWLFDDEGLTFDKLGAKNGIHLELTPVEGLMIMWNLPITGWNDAYKMFEGQDIAAKYTIGDIGTIKLGWGGKGGRAYKTPAVAAGWWDGSDEDNGVFDSYEDAIIGEIEEPKYRKAVAGSDEEKYLGDINIGFDLTGIDNLFLTVGAKISIASEDYKLLQGGSFGLFKLALGASYQITDNFKVSASYGMQTYAKVDSDNKKLANHQFGIGIDVGLTDSLSLSADFRGLIDGGKKVLGEKVDGADPVFSFLVGLQYTCSSNGYIGIGFQGVTKSNGFLKNGGQSAFPGAKADAFSWAVPIAVSVWF